MIENCFKLSANVLGCLIKVGELWPAGLLFSLCLERFDMGTKNCLHKAFLMTPQYMLS